MLERPLKVLAVAGSLNEKSVTRVVIQEIAAQLRERGAEVDIVDFYREPLAMFNPELAYKADYYGNLQKRVESADVYILGTPDYHGSISSALKNFLDHFWQEFAGKLFGTVVSSFEKGLTVTDQLRTVARQCYGWSLPYGLSFNEREDIKEGAVSSDYLKGRIAMFVHDLAVYGPLLAWQRESDLAGSEPGFMARYRAEK
ncbi:MAG: NADPH-dependent FMN reductase [Verrucomicrobiales bacterium]